MAESYPKSKLKRKKPSAGKPQAEICSRDSERSGQPTLLRGDGAAESGGSVVPAAAWWNSEQLPAAESLWAHTLRSALPHLHDQRRDLVPDLPHPSAVKAAGPQPGEQCAGRDLGEGVAPLPEPARPSPRDAPSPDLSARSEPAPHAPAHRQPSAHSGQRRGARTPPPQALAKRRRPAPHDWPEPASPPGCSSVSGEDLPLANQAQVSGSPGPLPREALKDGEEEEVQGGVGGDAGGGLQSCPMCLLVFPAGFSQMDCDSHLAQCLSEMNVDITW